MPAEGIAMRQVRDVLRLKAAGVSGNEIARRVGVASSTVRLTLKRLAVAGLSWPLPAELTDTALERQLFTPRAADPTRPSSRHGSGWPEPCVARRARFPPRRVQRGFPLRPACVR